MKLKQGGELAGKYFDMWYEGRKDVKGRDKSYEQ